MSIDVTKVKFEDRSMRAITPTEKLLRASADAWEAARDDPAEVEKLKVTTLMEMAIGLSEIGESMRRMESEDDRRLEKALRSNLDLMKDLTNKLTYQLSEINRGIFNIVHYQASWSELINAGSRMTFGRAYHAGRERGLGIKGSLGFALMTRKLR